MASDPSQPAHDPPPAYLHEGRIEPPEHPERLAPEDTVGRRWGMPALIAWVTLSAFAGALWFAYEQGLRKGMESMPPLIKADTSPAKVPPDHPGGMAVPHQDKEIYERMAGTQQTEEQEERLRPEPERPAPKKELLAAAGKNEVPANATTIPVPPLPKIRDAEAATEPAVEPEAATVQAPESAGEPVAPAENAGEAEAAKGTEAGGLKKATEPAQSVEKAEAKLPPPVPLVPKVTQKAEIAPANTVAETKAASPPQVASISPTAAAATVETGFRVQLGAYRTAAAAEGGWERLREREEALLGSLDYLVRRVDLGEKGIFFRLQAGPLDGPGSARAMCNKLQQRQLGCLVVPPTSR